MWSMLTYSNLLTYFVKKKMVIYSVNMEHLKNAIDKVKNITQANLGGGKEWTTYSKSLMLCKKVRN